MTLVQIWDTSHNTAFAQKVRASVWKAAQSIVGEDWQTLTFSEAKANKRHAVGIEILRGNQQTMQSFINAVAANIGEVADPDTLTDNDIDTSVASVWDDIAGVMHDE